MLNSVGDDQDVIVFSSKFTDSRLPDSSSFVVGLFLSMEEPFPEALQQTFLTSLSQDDNMFVSNHAPWNGHLVQQFDSGYKPQRTESKDLNRNLHTHVHSSIYSQ